MAGTRWRELLVHGLRVAHRELKLTFTPLTAPEKWVFIVGCYNSGTELLMNVLGTHPRISSLPVEGQFLTDQFESDYELGLPRMWVLREDFFRLTEADEGPDLVRLKKEWLMRLDRSRPVFVEKSPANSARTRWLQANFENAHFVAIVRNGYAVAEGIRRKSEPRHRQDGWPLELCARQWARSNEILLEDAPHLDNLLWTRYEDLADDPERELTRILDFLGLEARGSGVGIDLDRPWDIHEREEPIRNMNDGSIGRLSEEDIEIITREARPMLEHFGYPVLDGAGRLER